ncbi:MAG: F0F1 ATP synthase subunit B [Bacteroidales bacterium]|nr:F0F1 ATP synthase subunit B [Bacteroidales bacterium]
MGLMLPDTGLLFWMIIIFAIVFALLATIGFPVINKMINKRRDYIDNSLKLAKEAEVKIADMQKEYERLMEQAQVERRQILAEASQAKQAMIEQAQVQAKDEADKIIAEAKVRIEAETESALKDIRIKIAVLSVEVAEKVILKNLSDDKQQMDFVYKMLDEMQNVDNQVTN